MTDTNTGYRCPWAEQGLALHNSGSALVCCQSRTELKDAQGQRIFWNTHTIQDALESPTRKEIQAALARGEQHPNCQACWDEENVGGHSRRLSFVTGLDAIQDDHYDAGKIRYLDLKLGNQCNLACRTCNPYVSSMWYKDWWHVIEKPRNTFPSYRQYILAHHGAAKESYSDDNSQLWQDLETLMKDVEYIDIYGAEPMMLEKLFDILRQNIARGYHKNQVLHFNTNATIWDEEKINILSQFKQLYMDLSIDGIGVHYDYTRYGRTWESILSNLYNYEEFYKRFNRYHPISVVITVSIFNIYYLDDIWQWFDRNGFSFYKHFNLAHMPHYVNIKILPDGVKKIIREKLLKFDSSEFRSYVQNVLSYMDADLPPEDKQKSLEEFARVTLGVDQRREQQFKLFFPEFAGILEAEGIL